MYSYDAQLNFQHILLQSSMSLDPSEIILICSFGAIWKLFLLSSILFSYYNQYFSGFSDKQQV